VADEVLVHEAPITLEGEAMLNLLSTSLCTGVAAVVSALRPPPPPPVAPFGEDAFHGGTIDARFTVEVESARAWIGAPQFPHHQPSRSR
jgi:hypothetical protein